MTWITGLRKSQYTMILSVGDVWSGNIDVCILIGSSVKMTFYYMCYRRRDIYIILIPISHHKQNFFKKSYHKDWSGVIWVRVIIRRLKCKQKISTLAYFDIHNTTKGPSFRFCTVILFMFLSNQQIKLLINYIDQTFWIGNLPFSFQVVLFYCILVFIMNTIKIIDTLSNIACIHQIYFIYFHGSWMFNFGYWCYL